MDITHRLDYPQLVDDARAAFQNLQLVEREISASGDKHYVARMLPFRTGDDKIEGAILSFVDVSLLRRSQREQRASAERLRLAVESTRDFAILTLDANGLISGWNPGAARLFGYEEAEIMGQPLALIFTDEDRAAGVPERELANAARQRPRRGRALAPAQGRQHLLLQRRHHAAAGRAASPRSRATSPAASRPRWRANAS